MEILELKIVINNEIRGIMLRLLFLEIFGQKIVILAENLSHLTNSKLMERQFSFFRQFEYLLENKNMDPKNIYQNTK